MVRTSTSGVWVLAVLFFVAIAAIGLGCGEAACPRSCAAESIPIAQATVQHQPARALEADCADEQAHADGRAVRRESEVQTFAVRPTRAADGVPLRI